MRMDIISRKEAFYKLLNILLWSYVSHHGGNGHMPRNGNVAIEHCRNKWDHTEHDAIQPLLLLLYYYHLEHMITMVDWTSTFCALNKTCLVHLIQL